MIMKHIEPIKWNSGKSSNNYENQCRDLIDAAVEWHNKNLDREKPQFKGLEGVFGITVENNDSAEGIRTHMLDNVEGCSGAQFHLAILNYLWLTDNPDGIIREDDGRTGYVGDIW
jgi:hypothetical protein